MKNKWTSLVSLGLMLGMCSTSYAYVMVRSGFGELKGDKVECWLINKNFPRGNNVTYDLYTYNDPVYFNYKDHKNLSVALGGRFNVCDIGALGVEVEVLGAYANFKKTTNTVSDWGGADNNVWIDLPDPEFVATVIRSISPDDTLFFASNRLLYLKNQRIAGAQLNLYWEQYLFDWLSVGIGGGIGGAYVCTKFTTLEWGEIWDRNDNATVTTELSNRRKYVHSGSLLYNFTLFLRAEKFETLFEVGYRHIGLHQMWSKFYGYTVPNIATMHSDQVYLGIGRTF